MGAALIYALADPRTGDIRYIGQSSVGPARARQHTYPSRMRRDARLHSTRWLSGLLRSGRMPQISVLEEVPLADLDSAEGFWIAQGRGLGWPLTNLTGGGGGRRGFTLSIETRAKIGAAQRGRKRAPLGAEHRAKLSAAGLGRKFSLEHKANLSAAFMGRIFGAGTLAKMTAAAGNRPLTMACHAGHPRTKANTRHEDGRAQRCRTCAASAARARRAAGANKEATC